jgi:hypothetical protein
MPLHKASRVARDLHTGLVTESDERRSIVLFPPCMLFPHFFRKEAFLMATSNSAKTQQSGLNAKIWNINVRQIVYMALGAK